MTSFSAPGKLVLCGEYAVLDGHPAVVAAVDVRARSTRVPSDVLMLQGNGPRAFEREEARRALPLLVAVVDEIDVVIPGRIFVDTKQFSRDGHKLGLGSSAAAAVACAAAALADDDRDRVHDIARAAHRAFQGGGSGIDVAASTYGGILRFEMGSRPTQASPLPAGVVPVVVDTGFSQSTQGFVDKYKALADRARHAAALGDASRAFLQATDGSALISAINAAFDAMDALGEAAGIDVVSAVHREIAAAARAMGGAAKPSGAGGGDVAIAFVPEDRVGAFKAQLGRRALDVKLGAEGLRRE